MPFSEEIKTTAATPFSLEKFRAELIEARQQRDDALVALRDTQRQLSETQASAGVGTWERLVENDRIIWSDETFRIHGLEPQSVQPTIRLIHDLLVEEDRVRVLSSIRQEVDENVGLSLMYRIRRPDGEIRVLHTQTVVLYDDDGNAARRYGTVRDVTLGKPADSIQLALMDAEESLGRSPIHVLFCDLEGVVTYANMSFLRLQDSVGIGDSIFEFKPFADRSLIDPILARVRDNQYVDGLEIELRTKRGDIQLFSTVFESNLVHGQLDGYSIFFVRKINVPDLNSVKSVMDRSMSEALRMAHVGHWERDLSNSTSTYSDQAYRILGVDRQSFTASPENFMQLIHPDDVASVADHLQRCYSAGAPFEIEFRITTPNGDEKYLLAQGERFGDEETGLKAIGTVLDVTERRLILDRFRQSETRFNTLFEEMQNAHEQLLRMSRRLSTVQEEERRRISLDLHDEAGGLLTAIQLSLQLIDTDDEAVQDCIRRSETIVDELIDRIHHLTHQLRPTSLDRLGLQATLLAHFREFQDRHGISLDVHLALDNENELSSEVQIVAFRIIQEALTNVVRHAFVRKASVRINRADNELWIVVEDKGVGTLHKDRNARDGIGLSGMQERAQLLGGTLSLESLPGEGTTMTARLPF